MLYLIRSIVSNPRLVSTSSIHKLPACYRHHFAIGQNQEFGRNILSLATGHVVSPKIAPSKFLLALFLQNKTRVASTKPGWHQHNDHDSSRLYKIRGLRLLHTKLLRPPRCVLVAGVLEVKWNVMMPLQFICLQEKCKAQQIYDSCLSLSISRHADIQATEESSGCLLKYSNVLRNSGSPIMLMCSRRPCTRAHNVPFQDVDQEGKTATAVGRHT